MKKIIISLSALILWTVAQADSELLSAQLAYQQALKAYSTQKDQTVALQTQLEQAKTQLQLLQNQIQTLETKYTEAQTLQNSLESKLNEAGSLLDNAWQNKK